MTESEFRPQYREGMGAEGFERLKEVVVELAQERGSFTANDLVVRLLSLGEGWVGPYNTSATDGGAIIIDLEDLGYIERIPESSPPAWRIPPVAPATA